MKRSHPPLGLVMAASVGVILVAVPVAYVVVQATLARSVAVALLGRPCIRNYRIIMKSDDVLLA